jgi:hypothetical protein
VNEGPQGELKVNPDHYQRRAEKAVDTMLRCGILLLGSMKWEMAMAGEQRWLFRVSKSSEVIGLAFS